MGLFSSQQKDYSTLTQCAFPGYVIKHLGLRHFLLAGGGGQARTGVKNEIQAFLLTYNQCSSLASANGVVPELRAKLNTAVDTGIMANMNADVLELDPNNGRFLIAVGQDKYCSIYKTDEYALSGDIEDEVESPSRLTLELESIKQILTDNATGDPYQRCVRFDRSKTQPLRMATGGTDGHVRIWNVEDVVENEDPHFEPSPIKEFHLNGEVNDLDFSYCGSTLATVSNKEALFWNINKETNLVLPTPERIGSAFKVRSIRFTTLGRNNIVFAVAYEQRQRTSKQTSFLALWSYNRERSAFNVCNLTSIKDSAISCMVVSPECSYIACGFMEGHLYLFETEQLQCVYKALECHTSFVTSVDFLPHRELIPSPNEPRHPPQLLPGPGCEAMASLISLSVDQTIKFHAVPYPKGASFSSQMLKLGAQLLALYVVLYLLFVY